MDRFLGHAVALFTIIIWGITFVSTKILLAWLSPAQILFLRFFMGWLALWAMCPRFLAWQGLKTEAIFCAAGFFGITLYFLLENVALQYTLASNVGVLVSTAPFFTVLIDWLVFRGPKPALPFYAGFALAMPGIFLVSGNDLALEVNPAGDLLAILAAMAWGFYSIFTRKLASQKLGTLRTTRRAFFYGLLLMAPVLAFERQQLPFSILADGVVIGNLLFLGIGASAICFATWTFCIARLGVGQASIYIYLVPVVTVLAAAMWLQESLPPAAMAGIVLVLAGLAVSERSGKLRSRQAGKAGS